MDTLDKICRAVRAWHQKYRTEKRRGFPYAQPTGHRNDHPNDDDATNQRRKLQYWRQRYDELATLFGMLARMAPQIMDCKNLDDGIMSKATIAVHDVHGGGDTSIGTPDETLGRSCVELQEQLQVTKFLRASLECTEIGLDMRIETQRLSGPLSSSELSNLFLPCLQHLWRIMAAMEPRLFFDPRPFWAASVMHRFLWQAYTRMFLLVGFEQQRAFRRRRTQQLQHQQQQQQHRHHSANRETHAAAGAEVVAEHDGVEAVEDQVAFEVETQRRGFRCPADIGIGADIEGQEPEGSGDTDDIGVGMGYDDNDIESWTISMLMDVLAIMTDEWNHVLYTHDNLVLVARCLLRYAVIGFVRTSPRMREHAERTGDAYVHDMPQYTVQGVLQAAGWLGVDREVYYGQAGACLRDMLAEMALVSHIDVWLCMLTQACDAAQIDAEWGERCLAKRLYAALETRLGAQPEEGEVETHAGLIDRCTRTATMRLGSLWIGACDAWFRGPILASFDGMAAFLEAGEGVEAEKAFHRSGLFHMLLPGEIERFTSNWRQMAVTPINVINALRPQDMTLYQDRIKAQRASTLMQNHGADLPACLGNQMEHLVLETFRNLMRMESRLEGGEAVPDFLLEYHELRSIVLSFSTSPASAATSAAVWARFYRWTRLVRHGYAPSNRPVRDLFGTDLVRWSAMLDFVTDKALSASPSVQEGDDSGTSTGTGTIDYPPFPQILVMRGAVLLWNPMAKPMPSANDDEEEETTEDEDDTMRAWIPFWSNVCPWLQFVLLDVSSLSMNAIVLLWLMARHRLVSAMLMRIRGDQHSLAIRAGQAKVATYHNMLMRIVPGMADFRAYDEDEDYSDQDSDVSGSSPSSGSDQSEEEEEEQEAEVDAIMTDTYATLWHPMHVDE